MSLADIGSALGTGIAGAAQYTGQAAARANGVSAAAQRAQGTFNQNSVNNANSIAADRIAQQYAFNSAQAADANAFTSNMWNQAANYNELMWNKSADWNEQMWQKMADFNAAEAQKNRDWQEQMRATAYQTAVKDMEKAGLNPILAATGGGIQTGAGSGSAASVGSASMSPVSMGGATGYAASGGLTNALAASEGNYTGQMEYMGGWLGLLSAGISGLSSAFKNFGSLGELGASLGAALSEAFRDTKDNAKDTVKQVKDSIKQEIDIANPFTQTHKSSSGNVHQGSSGKYGSYYSGTYYPGRGKSK